MIRFVAIDLTTNTISHPNIDSDEAFDEVFKANPNLVLFTTGGGIEPPHTHLRYALEQGRVRHRLCCPTDVPAKVRAAFLLAN